MQSVSFRRHVVTLLVPCIALSSFVGCGPKSTPSASMDTAGKWANEAWTATRDGATGAWNFASKSTAESWTVLTEKAQSGGDTAWDAGKAAMLWSKDRSLDGWSWIKTNVTSASEWTADQAANAWMITRKSTGEFFVWVKVETENGVSYVRTAVPAAWNVTKDQAGDAWVWVGDHQIEAAVFASVLALVVTGLVIEPMTTSTLLSRGAITRAGSEFLVNIYDANRSKLNEVSEGEFVAIGSEAIQQNAANATTTH